MKRLGVTQQVAAKEAGISSSYISQWSMVNKWLRGKDTHTPDVQAAGKLMVAWMAEARNRPVVGFPPKKRKRRREAEVGALTVLAELAVGQVKRHELLCGAQIPIQKEVLDSDKEMRNAMHCVTSSREEVGPGRQVIATDAEPGPGEGTCAGGTGGQRTLPNAAEEPNSKDEGESAIPDEARIASLALDRLRELSQARDHPFQELIEDDTNEYDEAAAQECLHIMKRLGVVQHVAADEAGTSARHVSKWLRGKDTHLPYVQAAGKSMVAWMAGAQRRYWQKYSVPHPEQAAA